MLTTRVHLSFLDPEDGFETWKKMVGNCTEVKKKKRDENKIEERVETGAYNESMRTGKRLISRGTRVGQDRSHPLNRKHI